MRRVVFLTGLAWAVSGCTESASFVELPPLGQPPKVLTKEEAEQAMADIRRKAEQQSADTLRQIETGSNRPKSQ